MPSRYAVLFALVMPLRALADCCAPNANPGCPDSGAVQSCVCAKDAFCCSTAWDETCIALAKSQCSLTCTLPKAETCCQTNTNAAGCADPVVESCVCASHPPCCTSAWTPVCMQLARNTCGADCPKGQCCLGNMGLGCDDPAVESCVCATDPYCCTTNWDIACANVAHGCGCGGSQGCCEASSASGCSDEDVQLCVCEEDPACCSGQWHAGCVALADQACNAQCPAALEPCCSAHDSKSCDEPGVAAAVCAKRPECCSGPWTQECADLAVISGDCPAPKADPCTPSQVARGTVDPEVEACVCGKRASCCTQRWDAACAVLATACGAVCTTAGSNDCCVGDVGATGCGSFPVQACVCDAIPSCCTLGWGLTCAFYAETHCGVPCPATKCCEVDGRPGGCDDAEITQCVCAADPHCCEEWGGACVALADGCGAGCSGPPPKGACLEAHSSSGCATGTIEGCVCAALPECCSGPWGAACVDRAQACTPDVCGDDLCTPGEGCSDCAADCACGTGAQCLSGACVPRDLYFFGGIPLPQGWGQLGEVVFGCGAPTLQRCTDPAYLDRPCGRALLVAARQDPDHPCHAFAQTNGNDAAEAITEAPERTLLPNLASRLVSLTAPPRPLTETAAIPVAPTEPARIRRDTPWAQVPPNSEAFVKGLFEVNGARVASCVEALYERHFDYHRFEDAAASVEDARAVYQLAYGPVGTASSIATRTINGSGLRARDGSVSRQLVLDRRGARSPFFDIPPTLYVALSQRPDLNPAAPFASLGIGTTLPPGWAAWPKLRAGMQTVTTRSFVWHRARNDAAIAAGYDDVQLLSYEPFKERFRQLVAAAEGALQRAAFLNRQIPSFQPPVGVGPEEPELEDLPGAPTAQDLARADALAERLVGRVVEALVDARALGCLEPGVTPCDWSPEDFVRDVASAALPGRERDLLRCYEATSTFTFSQLANFALPTLGTKTYPARDYLASASALDDLTVEKEAWVRDVVAHVTGLGLAVVDGVPTLGQVMDMFRDALPDRWFGFDTAFHYDWSLVDVAGSDPNEPSVDVQAFAAFDATVVVLGRTVPLAGFRADFGGTVEPAESSVHVELLGATLYAETFSTRVPQRWDLVRTRYEDNAEIRADGPIFVIAGVPIRISGGIGGSIAFDFDMTAAAPTAEVRADLRTTFRPSAEVYGFLEAAVDYAIVRAGIRGELVLIGADIPTNFWARVSLEDNAFVARAAASSIATLRSLNGRFKLFAEINLGITKERYEKRIASWRGVETRGTLFATDFEVPLFGLIEACAIPGALVCESSDAP